MTGGPWEEPIQQPPPPAETAEWTVRDVTISEPSHLYVMHRYDPLQHTWVIGCGRAGYGRGTWKEGRWIVGGFLALLVVEVVWIIRAILA